MHNMRNNLYEKWLMYHYLKSFSEVAGGYTEEEAQIKSGYKPDDNYIAERIRSQYFMNMHRRLSAQPPSDG
jgi:hypothetical protein